LKIANVFRLIIFMGFLSSLMAKADAQHFAQFRAEIAACQADLTLNPGQKIQLVPPEQMSQLSDEEKAQVKALFKSCVQAGIISDLPHGRHHHHDRQVSSEQQ